MPITFLACVAATVGVGGTGLRPSATVSIPGVRVVASIDPSSGKLTETIYSTASISTSRPVGGSGGAVLPAASTPQTEMLRSLPAQVVPMKGGKQPPVVRWEHITPGGTTTSPSLTLTGTITFAAVR